MFIFNFFAKASPRVWLARTVDSRPFNGIQKTPLFGVFWCTRWGFGYRQSFATCVARANRGFSPFQRDTKNTPVWGVLVYPLGLEPRLDSVGGCNVIQLHYGYVSLSSNYFQKALIFYYFLLSFCKRLCYNIFKLV